jgi:hypothetical protein
MGLSNHQIAQHLNVTEPTVNSNLTKVFLALDVRTRSELAALLVPYISGGKGQVDFQELPPLPQELQPIASLKADRLLAYFKVAELRKEMEFYASQMEQFSRQIEEISS